MCQRRQRSGKQWLGRTIEQTAQDMFGFPARRYRNEEEAPITVSTSGHPPKLQPTSRLEVQVPFSTPSHWWAGVVLLTNPTGPPCASLRRRPGQ
jgi:hypothetical protein